MAEYFDNITRLTFSVCSQAFAFCFLFLRQKLIKFHTEPIIQRSFTRFTHHFRSSVPAIALIPISPNWSNTISYEHFSSDTPLRTFSSYPKIGFVTLSHCFLTTLPFFTLSFSSVRQEAIRWCSGIDEWYLFLVYWQPLMTRR